MKRYELDPELSQNWSMEYLTGDVIRDLGNIVDDVQASLQRQVNTGNRKRNARRRNRVRRPGKTTPYPSKFLSRKRR